VRFLLDENVSRSLAAALVDRSHDVLPLPGRLPSAADTTVPVEARRTRRIPVTLDIDFEG
jgi:predicted nuclease of predicted toxin-antitoxin system